MKCGIVISLQDVSFSWFDQLSLKWELKTNNRLPDPILCTTVNHMAREAMIKDDFVTTESFKTEAMMNISGERFSYLFNTSVP